MIHCHHALVCWTAVALADWDHSQEYPIVKMIFPLAYNDSCIDCHHSQQQSGMLPFPRSEKESQDRKAICCG
jgi:hypothetical protein